MFFRRRRGLKTDCSRRNLLADFLQSLYQRAEVSKLISKVLRKKKPGRNGNPKIEVSFYLDTGSVGRSAQSVIKSSAFLLSDTETREPYRSVL
jgi:hypothetical protein